MRNLDFQGVTFMMHRHNGHQFREAFTYNSACRTSTFPAAVRILEALSELQFSLLPPFCSCKAASAAVIQNSAAYSRQVGSQRVSAHQFCRLVPLISVCVSFHKPYIVRLACGQGNAKTVSIHLTKPIEKLRDQL